MMEKFRQRYRYSFILLHQLVVTDFKLRYQGSALGYIWTLLRPLFMFVILYLVFGVVFNAGASVPNYPVYLLLGILLWNYFSEVTNNGIQAISSKGDLLRKLNFPKYVIILAGSISAFINLVINFFVLIAFMAIAGVEVYWHASLFLLILVELFVLAIGMAFLLSALYVKFRDIGYIWEIIMQAGFYFTPILYPITLVIDRAPAIAQIQMLNPMAQIIQDARYLLITPQTSTFEQIFSTGYYRLWPIVAVILFTILAAWYFRRQSPKFAEYI